MVSPRKANSPLSLIPEEQKRLPSNKKSCESLCSQASSKSSAQLIYQARQPKMAGRQSQPPLIPASSDIRQRVLSARRLRMKTYQNQLADAQQTISELIHENRILRTLHKRQDTALAKYESSNAELPQLLHSHSEELRVWQTKYRNLQTINKELEQKLKQKEALILSLTDQNKYYIQLNKDKNLDERQRLTEKVQMLEGRLQEKDNELKLMARKLQLEGKKFKHQMQLELTKSKTMMMKLDQARLELSSFRKLENLHIQERLAMQIKQNKPIIGGGDKKTSDNKNVAGDPHNDTETADESEEGMQNHSPRGSRNVLQSAATIKKDSPTNSQSPTAKLLNPSTAIIRKATGKMTNLTNEDKVPKATLRCIDRGDGDATNNRYKATKSNTKQSMHALSSLNKPQPEKLKKDYEDMSFKENSEALSGDETTDESIKDYIRRQKKNLEDNDDNENYEYNEVEIKGNFMSNIDAENYDEVDDNNHVSENDLYNQMDNIELTDSTGKSRMKDEISTIRKKITSDYKEREAFLDTFCRQATNNITQKDMNSTITAGIGINKKRSNQSIKDPPIPATRKDKLLAALKAIDNDKSLN